MFLENMVDSIVGRIQVAAAPQILLQLSYFLGVGAKVSATCKDVISRELYVIITATTNVRYIHVNKTI